MAIVDEDKILNYILKKQGDTVPEIASIVEMDENLVWKAVTSLLRQQKIQFVYMEGFHFYEYPLVICPYCVRKFLKEPALKEHLFDHLVASITRSDASD
ncbi:MAG: hypothetical protein ACFFCQ_00640 [Promethearchaeota archaeon]